METFFFCFDSHSACEYLAALAFEKHLVVAVTSVWTGKPKRLIRVVSCVLRGRSGISLEELEMTVRQDGERVGADADPAPRL